MFWLVKIWQVSSCGKFMQRLETCLLWQLKLTEFCVILWYFKLSFSTWYQYKMKHSCYQDCSVIHGWFLYCAFCWQMHRLSSHWKSDFGWHRFQKWGYSLALAWGVRGLKSLKRSWNTWWPSEATSRLVSLSNYCLWCACVCVCFFFGFLKWSVWFILLKFIHEQWSKLQ